MVRCVDAHGPGWQEVQVRYATTLTSEQYVSQRGWEDASLAQCPLHPQGGCGLVGHGSYGRVRPAQMRVARLLCPKAGVTISLLPDFLASRLGGTLLEVEQAVAMVQHAPSLEKAAGQARPADADTAVTLPSALRWLRRRVTLVRAALLGAITLVPELWQCAPTIATVRERLGVVEALRALRGVAAAHLGALPPPLGFGARVSKRATRAKPHPHETGPDPPACSR